MPHRECRFDGGYPPEIATQLEQLFADLQPGVVAFQAANLMPNPVRWVGTESGYAAYPMWSTAAPLTYGQGNPDSPYWYPAEADYTLQNDDQWFYNPTAGVHTPAELRAMYEATVGHNTAIIVDIAPYPNGSVPLEQVQAAQAMGQYISECYYSPPVAAKANPGAVYTVTLALPRPTVIDRVVTQENQTFGQHVRAYNVSAVLSDGKTIVQLANGSSIGNQKIDVLSAPANVSSVTLSILQSVGTPQLRFFGLYACDGIAAAIDAAWDAEHPGWAEQHAARLAQPAQHKYVRHWALPYGGQSETTQ